MEIMKLLVTLDFPPEHGGIQRYLYNLVKYTFAPTDRVLVGNKGFVKKKYLELLCSVDCYSTVFSFLNKKISLIPLFFVLYGINRKRISDLNFEAGNLYAAIPLFILSYLNPIQYSVYCHGRELLPLQGKGLKWLIYKKILMKAESLYCVSKYTGALVLGFGFNGKVVFIPPKISTGQIEVSTRKRTNGCLNLLSVGRFVPHKGHIDLIHALSLLPKNMNWKMTFAGSGPQFSIIKDTINSFGLQDKITIEKSPDDHLLDSLYKNADIFLFPSQECQSGTEGFGIVLLEAMAYGIPIIASRAGAIPEVLADGACGILVSSKNPLQWSSAIINLADNSEMRQKIVDQAFIHLEKNYVWK
jgi:phosphatidylinositol alpha-1,6-mannosyltransferase